jgi:hypothetical protein
LEDDWLPSFIRHGMQSGDCTMTPKSWGSHRYLNSKSTCLVIKRLH